MLSWLRRRISAEGGNAALEFAILLPFLLALTMGIIEFGRLFHYKQVLTNAAREGARASATGSENYKDAANKVLQPAGVSTLKQTGCAEGDFPPSPTKAGTANICNNNPVTVTDLGITAEASEVALAYTLAYITPLGEILDVIVGGDAGWGSQVTLTARSMMRNRP